MWFERHQRQSFGSGFLHESQRHPCSHVLWSECKTIGPAVHAPIIPLFGIALQKEVGPGPNVFVSIYTQQVGLCPHSRLFLAPTRRLTKTSSSLLSMHDHHLRSGVKGLDVQVKQVQVFFFKPRKTLRLHGEWESKQWVRDVHRLSCW